MLMKKMIKALVLLFVVMGLGACSAEADFPDPQADKLPAAYDSEPVDSTLLQGSPSGLWFMLSTGISECVGKTYSGSILQITPGAGTTNVDRLLNGEAEFILAHQTYALSAFEGSGNFSEPHPEIAGIASFYSSSAQFVLRESLGISTFEEIVENEIPLRLSLGSKGNINELAFLQVLEIYGLSLQQMEEWGCIFYHKSQSETQSMFADGTIDGYFLTVSVPSPTILENSIGKNMAMVSFAEDKLSEMCQTFGYKETVLPAGTYNFLNSDYNTFANQTILATSSTADAEVVYKITKSICQNIDYLRLIHASLSELDENSMISELKLPLHPGALEYYREAGLIE